MSGQLFLRFTDQSLQSSDRLFGFDIDQSQWALLSGLNLSIR